MAAPARVSRASTLEWLGTHCPGEPHASAAEEPAALAGRVWSTLESGDLAAIRDLLGHDGVRQRVPATLTAATATRSSPGGPARGPRVRGR
jgi:hypothetical protein